VIGGGVGGIAVAVNLLRQGIHDFVVLEQSSGLGGTWWHNRYPGAEVDVTSELYSFSFLPHVFSRTHVRQKELLAYIDRVVETYAIGEHTAFNTRVSGAVWRDDEALWEVTATDGRVWRARMVISAVGLLSDPRIPSWPGMDTFGGDCFHTARWPEDVDLTGKTVAVIGTGSTGAQVVSTIAPVVEHLYLFQRQPGWVLPKPDYDYTAAERADLRRRPLSLKTRRVRAFLQLERLRRAAMFGSRRNLKVQKVAEQYLQEAVADPELRAALTPDYPFGRKRPVLSKDFFPALQRSNVTLIPRAVESLSTDGVVDDEGKETLVDVVVVATGFKAEQFLSTIEVRGRCGKQLHELWGAEPRAFLGLMTPGFPNFVMLYGPNTNGGDVLFTLERQAEWVTRAAKRLLRSDATALDVRQSLFDIGDRILLWRNEKFSWAGGTNNYYTSASGRVVTQWPFTQSLYWLMLRLFDSKRACKTVYPSGRESRRSSTSEFVDVMDAEA
jgi:cation diffusion facilitator CzcD-associated flavoprotein CzcO